MASGRIWFLVGLASVYLGIAAAVLASDQSTGPQQRSLTINSTSESSLQSPGADAEYYAASGDGVYVQRVNSPNDFASALASAQASLSSLAKASNASSTPPNDNPMDPTRPSYEYGYSLYNFEGAVVPPPAFAKDMFQCVFNLFELVPRTSLGVWTPLPEGHFVYPIDLGLGKLELNLLDNPIGYDMSYLELASVIKLLHFIIARGGSRSFELEIRAKRDGMGESLPVIRGAWKQDEHEQPANNSQIGSPQPGGLDIAK